MDIWRWIVEYTEKLLDDGKVRLARLLITLPEATCDDRHEDVDAMVPEALALVRAENNPWAEVYVRHWHLQSKVLHRHLVKDCLPDAIDLLEFANRPETRNCPQSVCVTQDLACAYSDIDGPGYADERLAVSSETLSRIDPTWPCFDCISGEYAGALMDRDQTAQCLAFVDEQRKKLAAHQIFELGGNLARRRALALLELGRVDEALAQLDTWDAHDEGSYRRLSERTLRARCILALGRPDEAMEVLPTPGEIFPTPGLYQEWITALLEFERSGKFVNNWMLGRAIGTMHRTLDDNGALYLAAWTAIEHAGLAVKRGAAAVARMSLEIARERIQSLRRPDALVARADTLDRELAEIQPLGAELDLDDLGALADDFGSDPERDVEVTERALTRWPDEPRLIVPRARALQAIGWDDVAETALRDLLAARPTGEVLDMLGEMLLKARREGELLEVLDQPSLASSEPISADVSRAAGWLRARALRLLGHADRSRAALRSLLAEHPHEVDAALMLAELERARGAYEEALAVLSPLTRTCEPGPVDWDRMIVATLLGNWDAVRDSAARLGMEFDGDGPIDEPIGLCRIRITEDSGTHQLLFARRTGPVTARIVEISGPHGREYYGDVIVFDATPLNPDANDEDDDVRVYPMVDMLTPAAYQSHVLNGVYPGDEPYNALKRAFADIDGAVQLRSSDGYEIECAGLDQPMRGMYAFCAAPDSVCADDLHALLRRITESWEHPIVWPTIAELLEDSSDELERQRGIVQRYGL